MSSSSKTQMQAESPPDTTGMRVLVVDNYDSFAYNLVQYVGSLVAPPGADARTNGDDTGEVIVRRNDAIDLADVDRLDPDAIVVSPGPGTPAEAGISIPLFADRSYPTLGVCLGHQALCAAHGAPVAHAPSVVHGKPSTISHDGTGIFAGLPPDPSVGRYHSLAVERRGLPESLIETAHTDDEAGLVMAVRHETAPHVGVQFHPESILTDVGIQLIETFLTTYADT
jgi:anthranilate synthase component 2